MIDAREAVNQLREHYAAHGPWADRTDFGAGVVKCRVGIRDHATNGGTRRVVLGQGCTFESALRKAFAKRDRIQRAVARTRGSERRAAARALPQMDLAL